MNPPPQATNQRGDVMVIFDVIKLELLIGAVMILLFFICLGRYAVREDEKRKSKNEE